MPPPEIAANRTQLAQLVATNIFGQNTPAIASTEIQYAEMWVQDALAMDGYAGSSAAATKLTPFTAAAANHQRGRAGQPGGRGHPGRRYLGRQRAVDRVVAVVTPQPGVVAAASGRQPLHRLHRLL